MFLVSILLAKHTSCCFSWARPFSLLLHSVHPHSWHRERSKTPLTSHHHHDDMLLCVLTLHIQCRQQAHFHQKTCSICPFSTYRTLVQQKYVNNVRYTQGCSEDSSEYRDVDNQATDTIPFTDIHPSGACLHFSTTRTRVMGKLCMYDNVNVCTTQDARCVTCFLCDSRFQIARTFLLDHAFEFHQEHIQYSICNTIALIVVKHFCYRFFGSLKVKAKKVEQDKQGKVCALCASCKQMEYFLHGWWCSCSLPILYHKMVFLRAGRTQGFGLAHTLQRLPYSRIFIVRWSLWINDIAAWKLTAFVPVYRYRWMKRKSLSNFKSFKNCKFCKFLLGMQLFL